LKKRSGQPARQYVMYSMRKSTGGARKEVRKENVAACIAKVVRLNQPVRATSYIKNPDVVHVRATVGAKHQT